MKRKKTKVINIRTYRGDYIPIDRTTIFGNPYLIGRHGTREDVINRYRIYFYSRIKRDKLFRRKVEKLAGKTIGCWCKPLPCHGDVIADWLNRDRE